MLKISEITITESPISAAHTIAFSKINVFCGKNNSGKTFLINKIISVVFSNIPFKLEDSSFNNLKKDFLESMRGVLIARTSLEPKGELRPIELLFDKIFLSNSSIEQKRMASQQEFVNFPPHIRDVVASEFDKFFSKFAQDNQNTALKLISTKRNLNTEEASQLIEVGTDGKGIVSALYNAKNQSKDSVLKKEYENLLRFFKEISNGFEIEINLNNQNVAVLHFYKENQLSISAKESGLGLQEIVIILYFVFIDKSSLLIIEEPETHLNAELQRNLLSCIRRESQKNILFSTHSNVFLNNDYIDKIYHIENKNGKIEINDYTSKCEILNDLGYSVSDNLISDLIILTEGHTDHPIIRSLLTQMGLSQKYQIRYWALGGDQMQHLDISVFLQNYKVIALIDKDPGSSKVRKRFKEKCNEFSIKVIELERYAIENYYPMSILREVFGKQIPAEIVEISPDANLENQIGLSVKSNSKKISNRLKLEHIANTDLMGFLETVEAMLQENTVGIASTRSSSVKPA